MSDTKAYVITKTWENSSRPRIDGVYLDLNEACAEVERGKLLDQKSVSENGYYTVHVAPLEGKTAERVMDVYEREEGAL